jgi:hypothetical protein
MKDKTAFLTLFLRLPSSIEALRPARSRKKQSQRLGLAHRNQKSSQKRRKGLVISANADLRRMSG